MTQKFKSIGHADMAVLVQGMSCLQTLAQWIEHHIVYMHAVEAWYPEHTVTSSLNTPVSANPRQSFDS